MKARAALAGSGVVGPMARFQHSKRTGLSILQKMEEGIIT
jgi:hypothetical protein